MCLSLGRTLRERSGACWESAGTRRPGGARILSWRAVPRSSRLTLQLALAVAACGGARSDEPDADRHRTASQLDANGCSGRDADAEDDRAREADAEARPAKTTSRRSTTNCGAFEITLDVERAPRTTASFKSLADEKFYDGTNIHRIVPGFVFQGGDPQLNGTGGPGYRSSRRRPRT